MSPANAQDDLQMRRQLKISLPVRCGGRANAELEQQEPGQRTRRFADAQAAENQSSGMV